MREIIEIIEGLQQRSGNEQLDYLKSHKDNKILKEVLQYTYDDSKTYNVSEAKLNKALARIITTDDIKNADIEIIGKDVWEDFKKALDELDSKKGVCDADVDELARRFFIHREYKSNVLLRNILFRDLRINMGVKLFSKVWKDFCIRYCYMGAKPFSMANVQKIKMPCFGQLKADGLFCNAIVDPINKTVEYRSRQGKPINIYGSLENDLLKITANEKFVLHGEILCINKENNKPLAREISNGIIRRDNKTQEELDSIIMLAWDSVPYKNFVEGTWEIPYTTRLGILHKMAEFTGNRLRVIDTYEINNVEEAMRLFDDLYAKGEEGIILKEKDIIWKDGKPKGCVKIKAELECDLRAIEFKEGSGAYSGMCGTIVCVSEDNKLQVGVKPRTPEQAQEIWNNQDKYINQILAVKYNAKIKRKDSEIESLFLPVFIEWRIGDKNNADNLKDIK